MYMLLIKNLLLLLIFGMSTSVGFFYIQKMGLKNPFEVEVHSISFNTKTCLACSICNCEYIIDNKKSFTLSPTAKTTCDVNPLGTFSIKMRDALLEEKATVNVTLKGAFYESFVSCLEEHAEQKTN